MIRQLPLRNRFAPDTQHREPNVSSRGLKLISAIALAITAAACSEAPTAAAPADIPLRFAQPAPPPPPAITVTALGSLPYSGTTSSAPIGSALNNGSSRSTTRVAGYTRYGTIREYPFTWTLGSGLTPLNQIEPGYGWPTGVSSAGLIVGSNSNANGQRAVTVTPGGPMSYLPTYPGATGSGATGITASGSCISGWIHAPSSHAVLWRGVTIELVGHGSAAGVSDDCLVVAGSSAGRATVWRNVSGSWTVETLPSAGISSEVTDISPSGEYVAGRRHNGSTSFAVVWRRSNGTWIPTDMPGATIYAFGVDNSGRAVGHNSGGEPMLWTRALTGVYSGQVLPSLGRSTQGWPAAINELGQVSGRSMSPRSGWQPVLWTIN